MNFAVWTMQRTGGTSLTVLLASRHPALTLHEPFNGRRQFGDLRRRFEKSGILEDEDRIVTYNIKHAYELVPWALNDALFRLLKRKGYFQIMLVRRDEVARMRSLALARLTGAFGVKTSKRVYPEILAGRVSLRPIKIWDELKHLDNCLRATQRVRDVFRQHGWPIIFYEDFFAGEPEDVENRLGDLLRNFAVAGVEICDTVDAKLIRVARIENGDQHSEALFKHVPNMRLFSLAVRARVALAVSFQ